MSPIQDTDLARVYQEERQSEAANRRLAAHVEPSDASWQARSSRQLAGTQ